MTTELLISPPQHASEARCGSAHRKISFLFISRKVFFLSLLCDAMEKLSQNAKTKFRDLFSFIFEGLKLSFQSKQAKKKNKTSAVASEV
jgi:hypothetical protein